MVTFRREGQHLVETINAGRAIRCYPVGRGDTLAFTNFPLKTSFERDAAGRVTGFRMLGADKTMPRLRPDAFLPDELLRLGRIAEAVAGYRALHLNEYQLTYRAYEFLNRRPDLPAAEGLLTPAQKPFPQSAVVFARSASQQSLRLVPATASCGNCWRKKPAKPGRRIIPAWHQEPCAPLLAE